ncbi:MAG: RNA polymerase sigma factor [Planctomycetota bacterium JB042]
MRFPPDVTLGQLSHVPVSDLPGAIDPDQVERLERAARNGGPDSSCLAPGQLRHALALSLGASGEDDPDDVRFVDFEPELAELSLAEFADLMVAPFHCGAPPSSGIAEFAWSIACEQRERRRLPAERGATIRVGRSFRALYDRCNEELISRCRRIARIGNRRIDPEALAASAWHRAFEAYWSPRSRVRFLGRGRTVGLLWTIARHEIGPMSRAQLPSLPTELLENHPAPVGGPSGPEREELLARVRQCVDELPPRRRLVCSLLFDRELPSLRVAALLRLAESTVSEHVQEARRHLRRCLERRLGAAGFGAEG